MRYVDSKTGKFIEVESDPNYKHKCLFIGKGDQIWKVGSFISDISADEFEKHLRDMLGNKLDGLWQY